MKNKMIIVIAGIAGVALVFFAGWYVLFCFLGIGPAFPFLPQRKLDIEKIGMESATLGDTQLIALVDTEKEAENIAQQYEIELFSFSNGVASYRTDENPNEVISRGEKNGYPKLYLNYIRTVN